MNNCRSAAEQFTRCSLYLTFRLYIRSYSARKTYNRTNICPRCREDNEISDRSILCPGQANRDTDENGEKCRKMEL